MRMAAPLGDMSAPVVGEASATPTDDVVEMLSRGDHPIEVSLRPDATPERFGECIDERYVLLRFTDTRGGTELGVTLLADSCDLTRAKFAEGAGDVRLVGTVTLNGVKVICEAAIQVDSLRGVGRLRRVSDN